MSYSLDITGVHVSMSMSWMYPCFIAPESPLYQPNHKVSEVQIIDLLICLLQFGFFSERILQTCKIVNNPNGLAYMNTFQVMNIFRWTSLSSSNLTHKNRVLQCFFFFVKRVLQCWISELESTSFFGQEVHINLHIFYDFGLYMKWAQSNLLLHTTITVSSAELPLFKPKLLR